MVLCKIVRRISNNSFTYFLLGVLYEKCRSNGSLLLYRFGSGHWGSKGVPTYGGGSVLRVFVPSEGELDGPTRTGSGSTARPVT